MPTKKKILGAAAFAAALAGGASAGAVIGSPSLSAAQDDPSSSSSDAPSTDSSTTTDPADCGPGGHHGFKGAKLDAAATALGITVDELRTELQAGKSIATVASEKGVDVQTVIDAIVAAQTAAIDQAVTDGKLTQPQADERKADLVQHITDFVNNTRSDGGHGGRGSRGPRPDSESSDSESTSS